MSQQKRLQLYSHPQYVYTLVHLYNRRLYPSCVLTSLNSPRVDPGRESPNSNKVRSYTKSECLPQYFLGDKFQFQFQHGIPLCCHGLLQLPCVGGLPEKIRTKKLNDLCIQTKFMKHV